MLLRTDIVVKQQARVSFSVRRFYYSSFELLPENFVLLSAGGLLVLLYFQV